MVKKIWITRNSASSIQFGGLERLFIHLNKPRFFYEREANRGILPFDDGDEKCGILVPAGWNSDGGKTWTTAPISFGNWIGYEGVLASYVWGKLGEHFDNAPFEFWPHLEDYGISKREDFLLELDLKIEV